MDAHFQRCTHQNPLSQAMFPELQWEMQRYGGGLKLTAEPDTNDAQLQVWNWLKSALCVDKVFLVTLTTWWEFSSA